MAAQVGPLVRGNIPKLMLQGIYAVGLALLFSEKSQYTKIFKVANSQKAIEYLQDTQNIGMMGESAEAANAIAGFMGQGFTYEFAHRTFSLQSSISMEAQDDNQYGKDFGLRALMFYDSDAQCREEVAMGVFNTAYELMRGDGQPLCSPIHPISAGGSISNSMPVQTGLSGTTIEIMSNMALLFKAQSGLSNTVQLRTLLVPLAMRYDAARIINSEKRAGTNNNDKNVFIDMDILNEKTLYSVFLQNQARFYGITRVRDALRWFDRKPLDVVSWMDNNSRTTLMNAFTRYSCGPFTFNGVIGSGSLIPVV